MKKSDKKGKHSQANLLHLLAFTAFLFLLAFVLNAGPVYAPGVEPDQIDPGDGGGDPMYKVRGFVRAYGTQANAPGVNVYLYTMLGLVSTPTDNFGYYEFNGGPASMPPNTRLRMTVNGDFYTVGQTLDNVLWGQWSGWITTDNGGSAYKIIYI